MAYLFGVSLAANVAVIWMFLRRLREEAISARAEREALLQMRVVNTSLQFAPEAMPLGPPPEPDDFERVGSILMEEE